jgi:diguanylate cyclase (GGDEF)-like protein
MELVAASEEQFGRVFGLLMLDVDRFKQINDVYGHDGGDAVWKAVAGTLAKSLRQADIVGRWGGEEFRVLLPDVSAARLRYLAERCRVLVESSRAMVDNKPVSVTISIGATLVAKRDSAESAIKRADRFMYFSKSRGRNQTAIG